MSRGSWTLGEFLIRVEERNAERGIGMVNVNVFVLREGAGELKPEPTYWRNFQFFNKCSFPNYTKTRWPERTNVETESGIIKRGPTKTDSGFP